MKQGEEFSETLKLMPPNVETFLTGKFDDMLWKVMENAANLSHQALEPMYSTLDPTLPTFHTTPPDDNSDEKDLYTIKNGQYVKNPSKKEVTNSRLVERIKEQLCKAYNGEEAKKVMTEQNLEKTTEKMHFLPDKRTSMINDEETNVVINTAFRYIIALMEFNMTILRFQIHHYLYQGFKKSLDSWTREVIMEDWTNLVKPDDDLQNEINDIEGKITGLKESLHEVQRIQAKIS